MEVRLQTSSGGGWPVQPRAAQSCNPSRPGFGRLLMGRASAVGARHLSSLAKVCCLIRGRPACQDLSWCWVTAASTSCVTCASLTCCRLMAWMSEAQLLLVGSSGAGSDAAVMLELQWGPGNTASDQPTTLSCAGAFA